MSGVGEVASLAGIIALAGQTLQASATLYTFIKGYQAVEPKLLEIMEEIARLKKALGAIEIIASRAESNPGLTECCLSLRSKLVACQTEIARWKQLLATYLKKASKTARILKKIKIAANPAVLADLRRQIVQTRGELALELSIFQITSGHLSNQTSQVILLGIDALRNDQQRSFATLNHSLKSRIVTEDTASRPSDPDSNPGDVHHDISVATFSERYPSSLLFSTSLDDQSAIWHKTPNLRTVHGPPVEMTLRLVQPAVLIYERKGKLRQVLQPLEILKSTTPCLKQQIVLLQYITNLRLALWLLQRFCAHSCRFSGRPIPSLLLREARLALFWNIRVFFWGKESTGSLTKHLLRIYNGSLRQLGVLLQSKRVRKEVAMCLEITIELDGRSNSLTHTRENAPSILQNILEYQKLLQTIDDDIRWQMQEAN